MTHLLGGAHGPNWHIDFVAIGLLIGVLATALLRGRHLARHAPELATLLVVGQLVITDRASSWVLLGVGLAIGIQWAPPAWSLPIRLGVVAALALGLRDPSATVVVTLIAALLLVVSTADGVEQQMPRGTLGLLVLAGAAGLWAGAPDTEKVVVLAAAANPVLWAELLLRRQDELRAAAPPAQPWLATTVVLLWAGAEGFHGRSGGIVLLPVVTAALCGPGLVSRLRPASGGSRRWPLGLGLVGIVGSSLVAVGAARTVGLSRAAHWPAALALTAAAGVGWFVVGALDRRSGADAT